MGNAVHLYFLYLKNKKFCNIINIIFEIFTNSLYSEICNQCKTVFLEKFLIDKLSEIYPKEYYSNHENKNFLYTLVPAILICGTICIILIFSNYLSGIVLLSTNNLLLIR